ncbi:MAG: glycosyltransferase [Candidatus Shapirobacteria bacterium]
MKTKKVAIVSDIMMTFGGAEVVVLKLMEMYPNADFYTLFISPGALKKIEGNFPKIRVRTSIFQRLIRGDKISKYISIVKIFSWMYWEWLDLNEYDLILSSSHSYMSKNVKRKKEAKHLSYVHTPPRYLYDEFNEIFWIKNKPWSWFFWPLKKWLRYIDKKGSKRADIMVANSENVAKRIKKYYQREVVVVYPPVEVLVDKKIIKKGEYYVCLSRLVRQKGIELAVDTCSKYKISLLVIGRGDELQRLRKMAGPSVEFIEKCDDRQKIEILSGAKALIYTSKEEDFGMVPVEALKVGTPVIAYASGGVMETVKDKKNGVLFYKFNQNSLLTAIKLLDKLHINRQSCIDSVRKYSDKNFKAQINNLILR